MAEEGRNFTSSPESAPLSNVNEVLERAHQWIKRDPNPETSLYVQNLMNHITDAQKRASANTNGVQSELESLFPWNKEEKKEKRIGFGTAGLRAEMKPGPMGMNDLIVIQTAQGLARYCQSLHPPNEKGNNDRMLIVVGYDHRCNNSLSLSSRKFALLTKLAFQHAGFDCLVLHDFVFTPLVPYTMKQYSNAVLGIMITASHNPALDNGYKVYASDAVQIRPPMDTEISSFILQKENLIPWVDYTNAMKKYSIETRENVDKASSLLSWTDPVKTSKLIKSYFESLQSSGLVTGVAKSSPPPPSHKIPHFAYTAMHGVGLPFAIQSFQTFFSVQHQQSYFHIVPQQSKPDPTFPTVSFPNPEEKGALDTAMFFAEESDIKCDIVIANDPDADRLAIAEKSRVTGEWTVFTGDQIGTMLGYWMWERIGKTCGQPVAMCASTVSSKMLSAIAQTEGFRFEETLTGFKWIGSCASSLKKEGYRVLLSYEEAIGFCCGNVIFDKDGISALGVMSELAYHVYVNKGTNLAQYMQSLYDKYGEFVSNNGYYRCDDSSIVLKIFDDIRSGGKYIQKVGNKYDVASIRDLGYPGYDSQKPDGKPTLPTSSTSPMMTIRFTNGCVAQFRASGTEPKFKYYIELGGKPGVKRDIILKELESMSIVILDELLKPEENGLVKLWAKL